jgi:WD40 repeat protein
MIAQTLPIRFNLRALFMLLALVAIGSSFTIARSDKRHMFAVTNLAFSPDGNSLAANSYEFITDKVEMSSAQRTIVSYSLLSFKPEVIRSELVESLYKYPQRIQFSADSKRLYFISLSHDLMEWNIGDRQAKKSSLLAEQNCEGFVFDWRKDRLFLWADGAIGVMENVNVNGNGNGGIVHSINSGRYNSAYSFILSADGNWLLLKDYGYQLWNLRSAPVKLAPFPFADQGQVRGDVCFSSDSAQLIRVTDKGLTYFDLESGTEKSVALERKNSFTNLRALHHSPKLIAGDGNATVVDPETGIIHDLPIEANGSLSISPDDKTLAVATDDGILLWDLAADKPISMLPLPHSNYLRWYWPWIFLGAWCVTVLWMWRKGNSAKPTDH